RGLMKDDEAARLDLTFAATARETGEAEAPDDIPTATDGTKAPTPRKVTATIVPDKPKEDRLLSTDEQNDAFDAWTALGGKGPALKGFLSKHYQRTDLAEIKLSELDGLMTKMQETLAA